jgi:pheromone alpha factor receptor
MVLTVVCIFLPLSAIWAGVANDSAVAYRGHDAHHRLINSQFGRGSSTTAASDSTTAFDKSRQTSTCTYAKSAGDLETPEPSPSGKKSTAGDDSIHVGREFIVRHEMALEHA